MIQKPTDDDILNFNFVAAAAETGTRLDAFLAGRIESRSRSSLQRSIENGDVLVNRKPAKVSYKIREGDKIDAEFTETEPNRFEAEDIPLDVILEDDFLAVINKPAGMVVHPGAGISSGTLANAVAFHFLQGRTSADDRRVGIVHRLDKDTSGLIVVAKDERTHEALAAQFRRRTVYKSYIALVHGKMRENGGTIDRPIARDRRHRTKMAVSASGRNALSVWKIRRRFEKFTLLDVEIKTGRTHQIRVHLASINHPVVGDETYNEGRDNTIANADVRIAVKVLGRVFLHSEKLSFDHPHTGLRISAVCPLSPELARFLAFELGEDHGQ